MLFFYIFLISFNSVLFLKSKFATSQYYMASIAVIKPQSTVLCSAVNKFLGNAENPALGPQVVKQECYICANAMQPPPPVFLIRSLKEMRL